MSIAKCKTRGGIQKIEFNQKIVLLPRQAECLGQRLRRSRRRSRRRCRRRQCTRSARRRQIIVSPRVINVLRVNARVRGAQRQPLRGRQSGQRVAKGEFVRIEKGWQRKGARDKRDVERGKI